MVQMRTTLVSFDAYKKAQLKAGLFLILTATNA